MDKVAVLIDYDNVNSEISLGNLLEEVKPIGEVVRKIAFYSNGKDKLKKENVLQTQGISLEYHSPYIDKKSTSDVRMAIKAMDLLSNNVADIFVIVSNDSDFIPLAERLKDAGKKVIIVTDNKAVSDTNFAKYFDKHIDLYKILTGTGKKIVSSGKKPLKESNIKDNVTNSSIFDDKEEKINKLLEQIKNIFMTSNIEKKDGYMNMNSVTQFITSDKKFNAKDYDPTFESKKLKDFFAIRLKNYFDMQTIDRHPHIKFKEKYE
jgi:uncharacterized protein (TIGR00288 family)